MIPPSVGRETRALILQAALRIVRTYGFGGLTLGNLARAVGMSKSGLFAHFKSIEQVHLTSVTYIADVFRSEVILPALEEAEGLPQLEATITKWQDWADQSASSGGCPFIASFFEFDDRDGPVRDSLLAQELAWRAHLNQLVAATTETGVFREDLDSEKFVSEICGIYYSFHVSLRFLHSGSARAISQLEVEALLQRSLRSSEHSLNSRSPKL
jgi:AcrR family transcriptional regulator